jgi:hypothetical protein
VVVRSIGEFLWEYWSFWRGFWDCACCVIDYYITIIVHDYITIIVQVGGTSVPFLPQIVMKWLMFLHVMKWLISLYAFCLFVCLHFFIIDT